MAFAGPWHAECAAGLPMRPMKKRGRIERMVESEVAAANGQASEDQAPGSAAETALVAREIRGPLAILTMQYRPYNLIGPRLMSALLAELEVARESNARAIVIRSGLRHFSAGADLSLFDEPPAGKAARPRVSQDGAPERSAAVAFLHAFETLPIPIIASVHGVCLGGGFELALACDYIIAAQSAKIGSVEATLGLNPLMGGVQRQVQRAGAMRAKEMSMLGRRYDPATLERWGLINLVVPDETLESATITLGEEFAHGPTLAHAATKELAYIAENQGVYAADEAMERVQKPIWRSKDLQLGMSSFRKNGPGLARFEGC